MRNKIEYLIIAFVFLFITPAASASEVDRLESEGWDMSRCQTLPPSTYNLKRDSDRIAVKFLNDTGSSIKPAYIDLKGNVKFLSGPKPTDEIWSDKTVRNTNWLWFDNFDRCLGMATATSAWGNGYQRISELLSSNLGSQNNTNKRTKSSSSSTIDASAFCLEGDCKNGVGKMPVPSGGYIVGRFYEGKMSGFAFQMLSENPGKEMFCEINMAMGKVAGVQHCFAAQLSAHLFMYPKVNGRNDGRTILLAPNGDVVSHKAYQSGKEITLDLYDSDKAAVRDGRNYLDREVIPTLRERRRKRDKRIDAYVRPELWDIPGFQLGDRSSSTSGAREVGSGGSSAQSISSSSASRQAETSKARESAAVAPTRPKPKPRKKEPIDILIEKAAELDRGARQYNPLYKLESVYVDTDAYELVYEFQALKSIDRLNQKAMQMGAEAAYCRGFKMIPFRKQNMPSRWKYLDADGNTMTIVTKVEDCS